MQQRQKATLETIMHYRSPILHQGKCAGAKWLEAILKRTRPFGVNSSRLVKNQLRHKLRAAGVSARGNTEGGQPSASPRLGVSS
jgi:hypothetical protein